MSRDAATIETYTTEDGQYRIRIEPDYEHGVAEARDGSNVATIVSTHSRYQFGDREADANEIEAMERGGWPLLKRYLQLAKHAIAITLIGMYDHSGITIYPMSEPDAFVGTDTQWDHSTAGFAYVTKADFEECSGGDPKRMVDVTMGLARFAGHRELRGADSAPSGIQMEVAWQNLYAELNDVDDVLTGNVYGYVIEHKVTWQKVDPEAECTSDDPTDHQGDTCPVHEAAETREEWEEIEDGSCWGFVGEWEYCMAEAKATLDAHIAYQARKAQAVSA